MDHQQSFESVLNYHHSIYDEYICLFRVFVALIIFAVLTKARLNECLRLTGSLSVMTSA